LIQKRLEASPAFIKKPKVLAGPKITRFRGTFPQKAVSLEAHGVLGGDSIMAKSIGSSLNDGGAYA
tara:strand:+ start:205 stop:402 length:198 start_codon:yes stop_codon:yes gene_type:complete